MAKITLNHYTCDHCGKEVVERRGTTDIQKWVIIAKGRGDFSDDHPLLITYMTPECRGYGSVSYEESIIETNLYFCSAECMAKYFLKHLGQPEIVPELSPEPVIPKTETPSRFDDIGD
jgi:hypothetical protein